MIRSKILTAKVREELTKYPLRSQDGKGGEAVAVLRLFITGTAAIEWQRTFGNTSHSWGEVAEQAARFERLGRRYGLLREFRENGVL